MFIDITGKRFGRFNVLARGRGGKKGATWFCVCDCGNFALVRSDKLRKGKARSCGCWRTVKTIGKGE